MWRLVACSKITQAPAAFGGGTGHGAHSVVAGKQTPTLPVAVACRSISKKTLDQISRGEFVDFNALRSECTFSFSAASIPDEDYALTQTNRGTGQLAWPL